MLIPEKIFQLPTYMKILNLKRINSSLHGQQLVIFQQLIIHKVLNMKQIHPCDIQKQSFHCFLSFAKGTNFKFQKYLATEKILTRNISFQSMTIKSFYEL